MPQFAGTGRVAAMTAVAFGVMVASPLRADGSFFQLDLSGDNGPAVGTVQRGRFSYSALHTYYDGGATTSVSVLYALPEIGGATLRLGPSLARIDEDGVGSSIEPGVRATLDRYIATDFGGLYGLVELNSVDTSWFILGQAIHQRSGFGLEVSRGGSESYNDGTIAISKRIDDGPISLRGGWRFISDEVFIGFSVNTF